jgi:hypothetical protein
MAHRRRRLGCVIVARGEADLNVGALAARWCACGRDCGCACIGARPNRNTVGVCTRASMVPESRHGDGEACAVQGTCKAARRPGTRRRLHDARTGHRRVVTGWLDGQHKQAGSSLDGAREGKKAGTRSYWLLHKTSSRLCACERAAMDKVV